MVKCATVLSNKYLSLMLLRKANQLLPDLLKVWHCILQDGCNNPDHLNLTVSVGAVNWTMMLYQLQ